MFSRAPMLLGLSLGAGLAASAAVNANANVNLNLNARNQTPGACAAFDFEGLGVREVGARNTVDWRVWLELNGDPISFWHDVPLYPDESNKHIVSFVVEIPRFTAAKIETSRPEPLNPLFHDTKSGQPRFVEDVWPHKSYPFAYGSVPQTWENPNLNHSFTGFPGDNDPVDLFDIGRDPGYVGQVRKVKVLGGLAVNDGNETDWKVLGIDVRDPLAELVESWRDVEEFRPGTVDAFREWWTYYKVARGDGVIPIVGDGYQDAGFMVDTIEESHGFWRDLVSGKEERGEIAIWQTSRAELEGYVNCKDAQKEFGLPEESRVEEAEAVPEKYQWWYYLDAAKKLIEQPAKR